jgi:hypothetical protein
VQERPMPKPSNALSHLAPHLEAVGASKPQFSPHKPLRFEDQVRILLAAKVPAFSFIYGIPPKEILEECHRQGILTIGTATTGDEPIALEEASVDVVVASGFESRRPRHIFNHLRRTQKNIWFLASNKPRSSPRASRSPERIQERNRQYQLLNQSRFVRRQQATCFHRSGPGQRGRLGQAIHNNVQLVSYPRLSTLIL